MAAGLDFLTEPERKTPVFGEYDVVVLGGGPAGIAAATAAAFSATSSLTVQAPAARRFALIVPPRPGHANFYAAFFTSLMSVNTKPGARSRV